MVAILQLKTEYIFIKASPKWTLPLTENLLEETWTLINNGPFQC